MNQLIKIENQIKSNQMKNSLNCFFEFLDEFIKIWFENVTTCCIKNLKGWLNFRAFEDVLRSTSEAIEGSSLSFESVNYVESSDCFSAGMLSVGHWVFDDVLQESSHDHSDLIIHCCTDSLDATAPGESPNRWLRDAHDSISRNIFVHLQSSRGALRTSFTSVCRWHWNLRKRVYFKNWL